MVGRAVRPQTRPTERAGRSASATINRLAAQGFGRVSGAFRPQLAARFRWQQGRAAWQRQGGRQRKNTANSPGCETKARDHRRYNGRKNPLAAGKCREKRGFGGIRGQNRAKISRSGGKRSRSGAIPERFGSVRERFRCPDRRLWQGSLPVTDQEGPPATDKTAAGGGQLAVPDASARVTATTLSSELRSTYLL
jgi:hypothetical protein